ncbi:MAG TPA: hypothetical protein VJN18_35815 [Polyangiaceae bacterium]|nr:hypothetical protein [Polyangiaceae bacterium]
MNLALFIYELRALGVKSLALELDDGSGSATLPADSRERPTLAPDAIVPAEQAREPEPPKDPEMCAHEGCGEKRGGLFRGGVGGKYCRAHALAQMGIRS